MRFFGYWCEGCESLLLVDELTKDDHCRWCDLPALYLYEGDK